MVWETRLHPAPLTTAPPPITELRLRRFGLYQDLAPATLDRTMKSGNDATFWRNPNSRIFAKYEIAVECSHLSNFQNTFNRYIYQMLQKISNTHHPSNSKYCLWKTFLRILLKRTTALLSTVRPSVRPCVYRRDNSTFLIRIKAKCHVNHQGTHQTLYPAQSSTV